MGNKRIVYAYVASPAHSGSTLLAFLLSTHPKISSVGEMYPLGKANLDIYRCSCGERYVECPFWLRVEAMLKNSKYSFSLNTASELLCLKSGGSYFPWHYPLPYRILDKIRDSVFSLCGSFSRQAERVVQLPLLLAEAATEIDQSTVFVDTGKEYSRLLLYAKAMARSEDVQFKVIHLVRDVRGVVCSLMRRPKDRGAARCTRYWLRAHKNIELIKRLYLQPTQYLQVGYSNLCENPERELDRISSFLGIDYDYTLENVDTSQYHIIGNRMRTRPIRRVELDNGWRSELSPEDLNIIRKMASKKSKAYGIDLWRAEMTSHE